MSGPIGHAPAGRAGHWKSRVTADILASLPRWFGRPEAVARYVAEVAALDLLWAGAEDAPAGICALRPHFEGTLEIWLLAVRPERHRKGTGRALIARAAEIARAQDRRDLAVLTLSPRDPDAAYAATRAFYGAQGFRPLLDLDEGEPATPMCWMLRGL